MKSLVVCKSVHHGNTKKIADAIADVLEAEVVEPGKAGSLEDYDLVGFGSGIYMWRHHRSVLDFVESLPEQKGKTFIFSTSGGGRVLGKGGHRRLRGMLEKKGFDVVGEFNCRGWDTYGPLKLFGGINKGRPDEKDMENARKFAKSLKK